MEFKKGIDFYVIHLPKTHNDTIKTEGGMELYIDPEWNPHHHRILKAELTCIPKKEKVLKVGDVVHFHPNVVNNDGYALGDGYYAIPYNEELSMVIAKENPNEPFTPLFNYLFVDKDSDVEVEKSKIIVGNIAKDTGKVAFMSDLVKGKLNLNVGDRISYRKLRNFKVTIGDKEYIRLRLKDVNFIYA